MDKFTWLGIQRSHRPDRAKSLFNRRKKQLNLVIYTYNNDCICSLLLQGLQQQRIALTTSFELRSSRQSSERRLQLLAAGQQARPQPIASTGRAQQHTNPQTLKLELIKKQIKS